MLNLMKDLSPNLHDDLIQLWDTVIPKLIQYLEGKFSFKCLVIYSSVVSLYIISYYNM